MLLERMYINIVVNGMILDILNWGVFFVLIYKWEFMVVSNKFVKLLVMYKICLYFSFVFGLNLKIKG